MTGNVLLQPAFNRIAKGHLRNTVLNPVPVATVIEHVGTGHLPASVNQREFVSVWGIRASKNGSNERVFAKLEPDDLVLFGSQGLVVVVGVVLAKITSEALGKALWGNEDSPWSMIYLVEVRKRTSLPIREVNELLGYEAVNYWHRVRLIEAAKAVGLRDRLSELVGEPLDGDLVGACEDDFEILGEELMLTRRVLSDIANRLATVEEKLDSLRRDTVEVRDHIDSLSAGVTAQLEAATTSLHSAARESRGLIGRLFR